MCPVSEATQEVGHAVYRVSKRGWEEKRRRGSSEREREGEHCNAYSPPLALKQQQEEREEGVRERRRKRSTSEARE